MAGNKGQPEEVAEGAARAAAASWQAPGPGHAGKRQAADPRPDPARRPGGPAYADQRAADDDQADHQRGRHPGTLIHTDEYSIYARLPAWGYQHKTVCHARGEYARDEDGTASARSTSTRWKASGPCCAPGCARTGASRRTSCRSISASSSSCTTRADAAKPCSARSSPASLHDEPSPPRNPIRA